LELQSLTFYVAPLFFRSHDDAFAMGPYTTQEKICFDFKNLVNLKNGLRFWNGDGVKTMIAATDAALLGTQVCIMTP